MMRVYPDVFRPKSDTTGQRAWSISGDLFAGIFTKFNEKIPPPADLKAILGENRRKKGLKFRIGILFACKQPANEPKWGRGRFRTRPNGSLNYYFLCFLLDLFLVRLFQLNAFIGDGAVLHIAARHGQRRPAASLLQGEGIAARACRGGRPVMAAVVG
jgi:endo-1,4-beta-D-glucanase Y